MLTIISLLYLLRALKEVNIYEVIGQRIVLQGTETLMISKKSKVELIFGA